MFLTHIDRSTGPSRSTRPPRGRVLGLVAIGLAPWVVACGEGRIVLPQEPRAEIDAPSRDTTVALGAPVTFAGTGTDPDGRVVAHAWAFGDGGTASVEDPGPYTYAADGVFQVTYRVTDNRGVSSPTASRTVTVLANQVPSATIDAPSRDTTVTLGDALLFSGTGSDPDGTVAAHAWDLGDGTTATVEDPGAHTYGGLGTFSVTYRVTDDDGATSPLATRTVTVVEPPNQAPSATITSPGGNPTVPLGSSIDFRGRASDPDGTVTAHLWDFGDGGSASVEDPGSYTYASMGTFQVTYRVTDDDGAVSSPDTRTVTVVAPGNQIPAATIDAPSADTTVTLGDAVSFLGSGSDTDGTVVAHAWDFGDGGTAAVEDPGGYTYAATGVYDVTYQVVDDEGATSPAATRVVTVVAPPNQPPTALITSPAGDPTVPLGSSIDFRGQAFDPDGTVTEHLWDFGDGGGATVEDPGPYTYGSVGTFAVTYRVTDDDGENSSPATRTVTIVPAGNQIPTATIDAPAGDTTVTLGDAVTFLGSASDPDGAVASHAWRFGDGGEAGVEDPGAYTYAATGTYDVTYQVVDDDGAPSPVASRRVTVVDAGGGENYALRFFGNGVNDIDRVKIPIDDPTTTAPGPPVDVGATDFTIEFWIRALPGENPATLPTCGVYSWIGGNIVLDRDRKNQISRSFGISLTGGALAFGVAGQSGGAETICGTARVDDGAWHHVAFTRSASTGQLRIWVDGQLDASGNGPGGDVSYPDDGVPDCGTTCGSADPFIVFGAEKHDLDRQAFPSFSGWLDEVRFSTVIRYAGTFTPPTRAFTPDASTAGLYHFDEGQGDVIRDSSGAPGGPSDGERRFGGSPAGPLWVVSDAPTGR